LKKLFKKIIVLGILIFTVSVTAWGAQKPLVVRYAYQPGNPQIVIARDKGWLKDEFEKDGIAFEISKFSSGPAVIEALTGGQLDFAQAGDQPFIQAKANNVDIQMIAEYVATEKGEVLLATKKSGIKTIADLKGKKVGITVGALTHQLLYIFLNSVGLKTSDIQLINLQPADIRSSLESNNIDAGITWEPTASQILSSGSTVKITDATGYKNCICLIASPRKFLSEHEDVTVRLLKVLDKTVKWIKDNREEAIAIVAKDAGIDKSFIEPVFNTSSFDLAIPDKDVKSVKDTARFLRKNGIIRKTVSVDELINRSYLKKAGIQ
jgi:ABC transporter, substrate-binding protein, aliphatic sulfonates family